MKYAIMFLLVIGCREVNKPSNTIPPIQKPELSLGRGIYLKGDIVFTSESIISADSGDVHINGVHIKWGKDDVNDEKAILAPVQGETSFVIVGGDTVYRNPHPKKFVVDPNDMKK